MLFEIFGSADYQNLMKNLSKKLSANALHFSEGSKLTRRREDEPLPVMVFVHGGAFIKGSGDPGLYGPDHLVDKHVILVTLNYRYRNDRIMRDTLFFFSLFVISKETK